MVEQLLAAFAPGPVAITQEMLSKDIPLTLAGISGAFGAVVVVFILFGLQSLERENQLNPESSDRLPMKRETAAIRLLLSTSSVAMLVLLMTPVFLLYDLATQALRPEETVAIGLGSFSFAATALMVGLFAFVIVSAIRSRSFEVISRYLELPEQAGGSEPARKRKYSLSFVRRVLPGGRAVFSFLFAVLAAILGAWLLVQCEAPASAWPYTMAIFLGALIATAMVMAFLAPSRNLSDLANVHRRIAHQHAVIALVFDARGRLIMHFQSPHRAMSWPEYWVPPGGLMENGVPDGAAQERLRTLVNETHRWGNAVHLASTNNSPAYIQMNLQEGQVPVQVKAYWVQWSDEEPWIPEDAYNDFDPRMLRLADQDSMPEPVPPYYPELFEYLENPHDEKHTPAALECWTFGDKKGLEAMVQARQR